MSYFSGLEAQQSSYSQSLQDYQLKVDEAMAKKGGELAPAEGLAGVSLAQGVQGLAGKFAGKIAKKTGIKSFEKLGQESLGKTLQNAAKEAGNKVGKKGVDAAKSLLNEQMKKAGYSGFSDEEFNSLGKLQDGDAVSKALADKINATNTLSDSQAVENGFKSSIDDSFQKIGDSLEGNDSTVRLPKLGEGAAKSQWEDFHSLNPSLDENIGKNIQDHLQMKSQELKDAYPGRVVDSSPDINPMNDANTSLAEKSIYGSNTANSDAQIGDDLSNWSGTAGSFSSVPEGVSDVITTPLTGVPNISDEVASRLNIRSPPEFQEALKTQDAAQDASELLTPDDFTTARSAVQDDIDTSATAPSEALFEQTPLGQIQGGSRAAPVPKSVADEDNEDQIRPAVEDPEAPVSELVPSTVETGTDDALDTAKGFLSNAQKAAGQTADAVTKSTSSALEDGINTATKVVGETDALSGGLDLFGDIADVGLGILGAYLPGLLGGGAGSVKVPTQSFQAAQSIGVTET